MEPKEGKNYQQVEITLSGRKVRDQNFTLKSNTYVQAAYRKDYAQKEFQSLGRTETQRNSLSPNFTKSFILDFIFESRQDLKFDLWHDNGSIDNEFIGSVATTVGSLMGAPSQTLELELMTSNKEGQIPGSLIIRCERVVDSQYFIKFMFEAEKLINTDSVFSFWDKSDPYLKLLKIRDDNTLVENELNPNWGYFQVQANRLINPNTGCFKVQVWDYDAEDPHEFMGQVFLNLNQLHKGMKVPLSNPEEKKAGFLILVDIERVVHHSFADFLRGGLHLNMTVAIDFTSSNDAKNNPQSLHFIEQGKPNQYQAAIMAISQILLNYDTDKLIPAFGFGSQTNYARICPETTNYYFPLSGRDDRKQASGLFELFQWYKNALNQMSISAQNRFGPVLKQAIEVARASLLKGSRVYQIFLILTEGPIEDMNQTLELLLRAAQQPLSLIIVGIGNAGFSQMKVLDGDQGLKTAKGYKVGRDLVQFVPFRDLQYNGNLLARRLLSELPNQVVEYMKSIKQAPGQFIPVPKQ